MNDLNVIRTAGKKSKRVIPKVDHTKLLPWIGIPDNYEDYLGFVYLITSPTFKKYIGKKLFWSDQKAAPLKGTTRKRRVRKETDWRRYHGSSFDLVTDLSNTDPSLWERRVLHLCRSKWELAYVELKEQMACDALFRPDYYNSIIHVRLNQPPRDFVAPIRKRTMST